MSKHMFILKAYFIAEVIGWGIKQNPFKGELPRSSNVIVEKLNTLLPDTIETDNIRTFVSDTIDQIPEIWDWNLSQIERECGVNVDDENRPLFAFTTRYDQIIPEYDFIDIDALKQNITRSLKREVALYTDKEEHMSKQLPPRHPKTGQFVKQEAPKNKSTNSGRKPVAPLTRQAPGKSEGMKKA